MQCHVLDFVIAGYSLFYTRCGQMLLVKHKKSPWRNRRIVFNNNFREYGVHNFRGIKINIDVTWYH